MKTSAKLQTNLCGQSVVVNVPTSTRDFIPKGIGGKTGTIRTVYYDKDGDLKYTVEVDGELHELYPHAFKIQHRIQEDMRELGREGTSR